MAWRANPASPLSREPAVMAANEPPSLAARTDSYFLKAKAIVGRFGDRQTTYAVFLRRPVVCAPRLAIEFLEKAAAERGSHFEIELNHPQGALVGAGEPLLYITGSLFQLVDLETVLLQRLGAPSLSPPHPPS